jgi:hypothetical protein
MPAHLLEKPSTLDTGCVEIVERPVGPFSHAVSLALVTLLALVLRLHGTASKSFWLDEGFSEEIARLPWSQFWRVLWNREANMGLYHFGLHFWLLAGKGERFIRAFSVLASASFALREWLATSRHRFDVQDFYPIRVVLFEKNIPAPGSIQSPTP